MLLKEVNILCVVLFLSLHAAPSLYLSVCFLRSLMLSFFPISVIFLPTSFCAKRVSKHPNRTYFYGWHRPLSFLSISWCWLFAFYPRCRLFTEGSGMLIPFSDHLCFLQLISDRFFFLFQCSGQTMKVDLKLEDGRIGEHPEVIYHVFHTLLFGGLALLFDGYL